MGNRRSVGDKASLSKQKEQTIGQRFESKQLPSSAFSPRSKSFSSAGSSASLCSPSAINIPANLSSCQIKPLSGGDFDVFRTYNMFVSFVSTTLGKCSNGTSCSQCEYHQFVQGYARYRASSSDPWSYMKLYGYQHVEVNQTTPIVDGGTDSGGTWRYGNRCDAYHPADGYYNDSSYTQPDQLNGIYYQGGDHPQMFVPAGNQYEFHLEFTGKVVDTTLSDPDNNPIATVSWTVECSG